MRTVWPCRWKSCTFACRTAQKYGSTTLCKPELNCVYACSGYLVHIIYTNNNTTRIHTKDNVIGIWEHIYLLNPGRQIDESHLKFKTQVMQCTCVWLFDRMVTLASPIKKKGKYCMSYVNSNTYTFMYCVYMFNTYIYFEIKKVKRTFKSLYLFL